MRRWIWSERAIEVHLVFGLLMAILFLAFLDRGNRPLNEDYRWVLLFVAVGYPIALFLCWLERRISPFAEVPNHRPSSNDHGRTT